MIQLNIYPRTNKIIVNADPNDMLDNVFANMLDYKTLCWREMEQCVHMPLDEFMDRLKETVAEMLYEGMTKTELTPVEDVPDWDDR